MRSLRIVLILLLAVLAAGSAFAQDLTETATFGNVSFRYPEGFTVLDLAPGTFGVADPTDAYGVILLTGEAVELYGFPAGVTVADIMVMDDPEIVQVTGASTDIALPSGEGSIAPADFGELGQGFVIAVDGPYGVIVGFAAGELPASWETTAENIVGSVVITEEATPEATATPGKGESTPTDATDTPPVDLTGIDGETCPIPVEALPDNTLAFCPGIVMSLLENWTLAEGTTELDTFASINRDEFTVSLSTTVNEISPFYNPETYARDVLPFIADISGHTTFDPAEHMVTLFEDDVLTAEVYDPADFVEPEDDDTLRQVVFILTFNNDIFVTHTFSWIPSFAGEGVETEIEQIVMSTQLAPFYDGAPAFVELAGEMLFINESTGTENTYSYRPNQEETFLVSCPGGLEGDEGSVWGTGIYTDDSAVCLAAAHSGAISLEDGGMVQVTMLPGQDSYRGSAANGVTSLDYGVWGGSFEVEAFELP